MSYSLRGNSFFSHLLKKSFPFEKDRDGISRRAAERAMQDEERAHRDATSHRLQRPATLREEIHGVQPPDTRSLRERIAAEGQTRGQPGNDPNTRSPWGTALASAERDFQRALLPADKARAAKRVELYRGRADAWQAARDAAIAEEARRNDPRLTFATADARKQWEALAVRPDVAQADVERARQRMEALAASGDIDAYWLDSATHEAEMDTARQIAADGLAAQAKALSDEAKRIRRDDPPTSE